MNPTISIITICFNNLEDLIITCKSVDIQDTPPYEHWIIDGSTNNDIRNYLQNHELPAYRKWISEKDSGIGDAFNKGILRATGTIVNMLNSGDTYVDNNVLKMASTVFSNDISLQWLHAKYQIMRGGKWIIIGKPFEKDKLYRGMRSICHQTMFVKKELHDRQGLYDPGLSIAMDYDFLCRIYKEKFQFIPQPFVVMAPAGVSATQYLLSLKQTKAVYLRYFDYSLKIDIWQLRLKILHLLLKSQVGKWLFNLKTKLKLENM
ncbi:glycosyltransferase [Terrimonas pollutisoli]|uniref:glycosyltransferase n=1 Tax=Terrimonas pollutisoli TaxID=3034147 RepID=UPI0023EB4419|nr:glycosyltransferase [Terrimonas sp. H1YJ31]